MRIHWLQHVPFEGLGSITDWAQSHTHELCCTRLFQDEALPSPDTMDGLIVMGGPMGVHDHGKFPWLKSEIEFIGNAVSAHKPVLGICLGAQLIATALGARVYRNAEPEIGWYRLAPGVDYYQGRHPDFLAGETLAFHWHGDTFDLPKHAMHLASTAACRNQVYAVGDRVLGLQCHLETTAASAEALIANCGNELRAAPFIQSAADILADHSRFAAIRPPMFRLLDWLFRV